MWLALLACVRPDPKVDVVLISLDTTRADIVTPEVAPTLSALGDAGVRFEMALSHAPTTLSSHTSVFTGLDPHRHRVPRNGFEVPTGLPTLAERLGDGGYQRIGVIGASVLAAETGVSRGFERWDEEFEAEVGRREERSATSVTDRALSLWAARDPARPTLLFVHYFDAHAPYAAPEPWLRRFGDAAYAGPMDGSKASVEALAESVRRGAADPADLAELRARYAGEVAYVDAEIGRLLAGLGDAPRVVVAFGDHGEGLGEQGPAPIGHGSDVDLWAIHVPLIISGAQIPNGVSIPGIVRLSDLAPTLLERLTLPTVGEGVSRWGEVRGGAHVASPHFAEANQPAAMAERGRWPNLNFERAVAYGGHLFVSTPLLRRPPMLYTLDAAQTPARDPAAQAELERLLTEWDSRAPPPIARTVPKHTRDALEALGYQEPAPP